jgi:hypothetical protein
VCGLTTAHVEALERVLAPHLPPREIVEASLRFPHAIIVDAGVLRAHEALDLLRRAVAHA